MAWKEPVLVCGLVQVFATRKHRKMHVNAFRLMVCKKFTREPPTLWKAAGLFCGRIQKGSSCLRSVECARATSAGRWCKSLHFVTRKHPKIHVTAFCLMVCKKKFTREPPAAGLFCGRIQMRWLKDTLSAMVATASHVKCTITLNPRRVWLEKTQGIWKGCCDACFPWNKIWKSGAVGRITCKVTITLNPRRVLLEKTQGIWCG